MDPSTIASGGGFPDLGLDGAVVVVTGAGSGIGAATALRLGAAGAHVVLVGRRIEPLELSARAVQDAGGEAHCVVADLSKVKSTGRIVSEAVDRFGTVDGLVNNAAIVRHVPLQEWKAEGFDEHVAVNVRAPFFLMRDALPFLQASPIRSVVNVSSSSGTLRLRGQSVYGMTKSALNYLTQSLAGAARGQRSPRQRGGARSYRHPHPTRRGRTTSRRPTGGWPPRYRCGASERRTKSPAGQRCCSARSRRLSPVLSSPSTEARSSSPSSPCGADGAACSRSGGSSLGHSVFTDRSAIVH